MQSIRESFDRQGFMHTFGAVLESRQEPVTIYARVPPWFR